MDKCLCDGAISQSQAKYAAEVRAASAKKASDAQQLNGSSKGNALLDAASAGDPSAVALFAITSGIGAALDLRA